MEAMRLDKDPDNYYVRLSAVEMRRPELRRNSSRLWAVSVILFAISYVFARLNGWV